MNCHQEMVGKVSRAMGLSSRPHLDNPSPTPETGSSESEENVHQGTGSKDHLKTGYSKYKLRETDKLYFPSELKTWSCLTLNTPPQVWDLKRFNKIKTFLKNSLIHSRSSQILEEKSK